MATLNWFDGRTSILNTILQIQHINEFIKTITLVNNLNKKHVSDEWNLPRYHRNLPNKSVNGYRSSIQFTNHNVNANYQYFILHLLKHTQLIKTRHNVIRGKFHQKATKLIHQRRTRKKKIVSNSTERLHDYTCDCEEKIFQQFLSRLIMAYPVPPTQIDEEGIKRSSTTISFKKFARKIGLKKNIIILELLKK